MKRLWKSIPPCLSDIMGFQVIINHSEGVGIVDDSSIYKPVRNDLAARPEQGGNHGYGGGRDRGDRRSRKGRDEGQSRVISSKITETDVIYGTAEKVQQAAQQGVDRHLPEYVLLTTAPSASMIATDLQSVADDISNEYGVPAAVVDLDGQKDYLHGISRTLEAMGKLLLRRKDTIPGTVNILGINPLDWTTEMRTELENWLENAGCRVLSRWGSPETTKNLAAATAAAINLVVNVAGLRLARYMESEFQIPYIVGVPFGEIGSGMLKARLSAACNKETLSPGGGGSQGEVNREGGAEALIIAEQVSANAIRSAISAYGLKNVRVCSFLEMDKEIMQPGDKKLVSEDELKELLESEGLRVVLGASDYRLIDKTPWITLPNQAIQSPDPQYAPFSMLGAKLDS